MTILQIISSWSHLPVVLNRQMNFVSLLDGWKKCHGTFADFPPIRSAFHCGIAEMEPDEDARIGVLFGRLREAGERPQLRFRIIARAVSRQCRTTILEVDLITEDLFQHLSPCTAFDRMT